MADTATLRTLLERVEQASGPDRELDQDVWHHLGQCAKQEDGTCADYKAPALSASVDAVLALIERALGPEWIAEIQVRADGSCAQLHEFPLPCRKSPLRRGSSGRIGAVLALLAATLCGLIAQQEDNVGAP
ncbi:MAG TPA: hypothetical protein VIR45_14000 [Kiloniellaceae bacterium]